MATPSSAKKTVLFAVPTAVALTLFSELVDGDDERFRPRVMIGGVVAAFFLLALSERAPRLTAGFAMVILITAVTTAGADTVNKLNPENIQSRPLRSGEAAAAARTEPSEPNTGRNNSGPSARFGQ